MKDAKGHGSDARGGNGQFTPVTGVRISNAARERIALRQLTDARKFLAARTSNRRINPPAMYADSRLAGANVRAERTDMPVGGAHSAGIHAATLGKKLGG